jgi:hypothetical protein
MTQFRQVYVSPIDSMYRREMLLAQPDEFFRPLFHGRIPTWQEKLHHIECTVQRMGAINVWENDTYRVEIVHRDPFIHLGVTRHDGAQCTNWRDFQHIKNELVGPENEAIELFPAESRLVDAANQYHLWVMADPHYRFPVGFVERFVLDDTESAKLWSSGSLDGLASTQPHPAPHASVAA